MNVNSRIRLTVAMLAVIAMGSTGWADGVVALDTALPPPGKYVSPVEFHAYAALGIVLDDPSHSHFENIIIAVDGDDEIETFDSVFTANEIETGIGPVTLSGPVQVRTTGIAGSATRTGTFDTEIIAMSLTGNVNHPSFGPVDLVVQIDPTRPSVGQTTINDIGGGQFHIDSFFDVFTEITVDTGTGVIPSVLSDGSTRMTLVLPEPDSTLALLGAGALRVVRRRRK